MMPMQANTEQPQEQCEEVVEEHASQEGLAAELLVLEPPPPPPPPEEEAVAAGEDEDQGTATVAAPADEDEFTKLGPVLPIGLRFVDGANPDLRTAPVPLKQRLKLRAAAVAAERARRRGGGAGEDTTASRGTCERVAGLPAPLPLAALMPGSRHEQRACAAVGSRRGLHRGRPVEGPATSFATGSSTGSSIAA